MCSLDMDLFHVEFPAEDPKAKGVGPGRIPKGTVAGGRESFRDEPCDGWTIPSFQ
jgi:hypothetical protein